MNGSDSLPFTSHGETAVRNALALRTDAISDGARYPATVPAEAEGIFLSSITVLFTIASVKDEHGRIISPWPTPFAFFTDTIWPWQFVSCTGQAPF
jgi:hypothetical protein